MGLDSFRNQPIIYFIYYFLLKSSSNALYFLFFEKEVLFYVGEFLLQLILNFGRHDAYFIDTVETYTKRHIGVNVFGQFAQLLKDKGFFLVIFGAINDENDALSAFILLFPKYALTLGATEVLY